jgi:hypothetical protein
VKRYWEIIADKLSKAGWSWGCSSQIDSTGRELSQQTHTGVTVADSLFCQTKNSAPFWNLKEPRAMTVIEIKPHRWSWKVFEAPGVGPVFPEKDPAINYAQSRASFRSGEIRILDSSGSVERLIPFAEADRKL